MINKPIQINEIFYSFQGEGVFLGKPSIFIRTTGCNLHCKHCDTKYSWKNKKLITPGDVIDFLNNVTHCDNIVITGGEPLLQKDLAGFLSLLTSSLRPFHITVETNCTLFKEELLEYVDLWSLSPKLPGMGATYKPAVLKSFLNQFQFGEISTQLKFVVEDSSDLKLVNTILHKNNCGDVPIILQPNNHGVKTTSQYLKKYKWLVEEVEKVTSFTGYNIRVLPQMHVLTYGRRKGI